jgi:hypothetical protein
MCAPTGSTAIIAPFHIRVVLLGSVNESKVLIMHLFVVLEGGLVGCFHVCADVRQRAILGHVKSALNVRGLLIKFMDRRMVGELSTHLCTFFH